MSLLRRLEQAARGHYGAGAPGRPAGQTVDAVPDLEASRPKFPETAAQMVSAHVPTPPPSQSGAAEASQATPPDLPSTADVAGVEEALTAADPPAQTPPDFRIEAEPPHVERPEPPAEKAPAMPTQEWALVVPGPTEAVGPSGPLAPSAIAVRHLARVSPLDASSSVATAPELEAPILTPEPVAREPVTAPAPVVQNQPLHLSPRSDSPRSHQSSNPAPTLAIGKVDIRITPPPRPAATPPPVAAAPSIAPPRHGKGLSVSSQLRRAGLMRL